MLILAFSRGGYTFDLNAAEVIAFFGIILTLCTWTIAAHITGRRNSRILFWGSIIVDMLSFYPQFKQYLLPHEPPTVWMILAWVLFWGISLVNIVAVDRMFLKLRTEKGKLLVLEKSAFSIEQVIFIGLMTWVMLR